jgi:hypothetical protein
MSDDKEFFGVTQAGGDDQPFLIHVSPELVAEGGDMLCPAKGCTKYIPIKEGAGTCACGAKFEIYPAILKRDDDDRPDPGA